jgi:hypothetical protein
MLLYSAPRSSHDGSFRSRRLGLQTIVSIVPEAPLQDLVDFCEQQHIVLIPITAEKYREEGMPITCAQVAQVGQNCKLMCIASSLHHFLLMSNLMHCFHGHTLFADSHSVSKPSTTASISALFRWWRSDRRSHHELAQAARYAITINLQLQSYSQTLIKAIC